MTVDKVLRMRLNIIHPDLAEFARQVGAGPTKQIVLVLDRAGWHTSQRLRVPEHVHLLFLPPYSLELQPAEHLWLLTNACWVNRQFAHCASLQAHELAFRPDPFEEHHELELEADDRVN